MGIDGHILTGRFQGTRTTLSQLLRAVSAREYGRRIIVYSNAPSEAENILGANNLEYKSLGHVGSLKRLLVTFSKLFRRDEVVVGVFQYMTPLTGRNVVFIHDLLPISHPHLFPLKVRVRTRLFFSLSIRRAAMVIAVSEFTRSEISRRYRISPTKLRVVLNGPSFAPEVYTRPPPSITEKYILTVGRIEPRKNVALLVEAFRRAAVPKVRLLIVGSWDPEFPRESIESAGVDVRSDIDDMALIELYRGASLFVYASEAEGFGIPLLDATLFGLPVITSNCTALPEVAGNLAEYFDPTATDAAAVLAERIEAHFSDRPVRRPAGHERLEQSERFSWQRAATDFLAAVESTIEEVQ